MTTLVERLRTHAIGEVNELEDDLIEAAATITRLEAEVERLKSDVDDLVRAGSDEATENARLREVVERFAAVARLRVKGAHWKQPTPADYMAALEAVGSRAPSALPVGWNDLARDIGGVANLLAHRMTTEGNMERENTRLAVETLRRAQAMLSASPPTDHVPDVGNMISPPEPEDNRDQTAAMRAALAPFAERERELVEALRPFALFFDAAIEAWSDGRDLDGGDIQEIAASLGLLRETVFNSEVHTDELGVDAQDGDPWFVLSDVASKAIRDAQALQAKAST